MGPIWGRQDPGGPHVGPMDIAFRDVLHIPEASNDTACDIGTRRCPTSLQYDMRGETPKAPIRNNIPRVHNACDTFHQGTEIVQTIPL